MTGEWALLWLRRLIAVALGVSVIVFAVLGEVAATLIMLALLGTLVVVIDVDTPAALRTRRRPERRR